MTDSRHNYSIRKKIRTHVVVQPFYDCVFNSGNYMLLKRVQNGVNLWKFIDSIPGISLCINKKLKNIIL